MAWSRFVEKFCIQTGLARFLPRAKRLPPGTIDALHYFSDRVLASPRSELLDPAIFPDSLSADVLNLNQAAPQFESPITGARVVADRLGLPATNGLAVLRHAIADRAQTQGRVYDPRTEVLVTHGATGAYASVLDAFINPGSRVVLFDPGSPLLSLGARSRQAQIEWVPTTQEQGRVRFDAERLYRACRGARLLVLSEPNNPTGSTLGDEELEQIAWVANRSDVLIYLDESFARYRADEVASRLPTWPGLAKRTLIANSLTQSDSLGSVRVGWLTGPRALIGACELMASLAAPYIPTICQQIAHRAIQVDDDLSGPIREEIRDRQRYAIAKLTAMGLPPLEPGGGYFLWVPVAKTGRSGRELADRMLLEHRVLVGPGDVFGPSGTDYIRISCATEDGRLREGLTRLAAFVSGTTGIPSPKPEDPVPVADDRPPAFSRV